MSAGSEGGFTLIEVLIALVILAVGLSAVLRWVSVSLGMSAEADDRVRAAMEAQSILAALPVDAPQAAGRRGGASDRGRWTMEIGTTADNLALVDLTVTVGRSSVRLTTLRPLAAR